MKKTLSMAALCVLSSFAALASSCVHAAPQVIDRELSVKEWVDLMYNGVPVTPSVSKAMSIRGVRPDAATHRCGKPIPPGGSANKKLEVVGGDVPVAQDPPASVNLALAFEHDSDRLSAKDKAMLSSLAQAMQEPELRRASYAIMGHTDATGARDYNLQLSCSRALIVQQFMIEQGVEETRLAPYGYGPDQPLDRTQARSAQNRRVEFRRAN